MTAISNQTPASPVTLPWTYVANGGQAYSLSSAQGAGCVDTVTPLTANAGGTFNVKGVPLYPTQAYQVIALADQQYGPIVVACQSLVNQLQYAQTSGSGVPQSGFPDLFGGAISSSAFLDDVGGIVILVVAFIALVWLYERARGKKKG